jgi:hypothetical protein
MRDPQTAFHTDRPIPNPEGKTGSPNDKRIPAWEQPDFFRKDFSSYRGALLLLLAFPTFIPGTLSVIGLGLFFHDHVWYSGPPFRLSGLSISSNFRFADCLFLLTLSACGLVLALPAYLLARRDLSKMRRKKTHPSGEVLTAGALFNARFGLLMNGLCLAVSCVIAQLLILR